MKDVEVNDAVLGEDESSFVDGLGLGEEPKEPKEEEETEKEEEEETEKEEEEETEKEEEEEEKTDDLDKDLTKEEIDKLPTDSKGLYYALRKSRQRTKDAEAKLSYIEIQNKYSKKPETKETKPEEEEKFETVEDILKDKADDDLLTAGEQRRIETAKENQRKADAKKEKSKVDRADKARQDEIQRIDDLEQTFKEAHSDYEEFFGIFTQALKDIPSLNLEIVAEMKRENGNPAKKAYELGKKFKSLYGKKPDNGKPKDVKRILKNAEKNTPSGSVAGSSVSNEELEEMDIDDLGKALFAMSMEQFMKVPKKIRQKALR